MRMYMCVHMCVVCVAHVCGWVSCVCGVCAHAHVWVCVMYVMYLWGVWGMGCTCDVCEVCV